MGIERESERKITVLLNENSFVVVNRYAKLMFFIFKQLQPVIPE